MPGPCSPAGRPRYRAGGGKFHAEGTSVRYKGPAQLVALGLMNPGRWF